MLILSQDKELIVNINNKEDISLKEHYYEGHFVGVKIMAENKIYSTLGLYATKERAKEVLQEIINEYKLQNYLVYDAETGSIKDVNKNIVFIMPKE